MLACPFATRPVPVPLNEHVVVGNEILKISTNSTQPPDTQFDSLASTVDSSGGGLSINGK